MSIVDGVSQCWWLSPTCVVNWNAWAAIGTFAAAGAALLIAGAERRRRQADAKEAATLAFISLWPRFHKAQARAGDIAMHLRIHAIPNEARQASLKKSIEALEFELAAISGVAGRLDKERARSVVGAVAIAGQVARQAGRIVDPDIGPLHGLWNSPLRGGWLTDCELAINQFLAMASESERAGNSVTGRESQTAIKDRWE